MLGIKRLIMSAWVTERMAGHCGARLSGVSLSSATNSDLEKLVGSFCKWCYINARSKLNSQGSHQAC